MQLRPNWRFLLKLAVALLVAGTAVHFVHRWQVRKQVGVFLQHADQAREEGDFNREQEYLERYLLARPDDTDVRERSARLLCRTAKSGQQLLAGYLAVEDVLRRDKDRDELRRFAIDIALDPRVALLAEAQAHVRFLLGKRPGDGELEGLLARCLVLSGNYPAARDAYERSIARRPDLADSYAGCAGILRTHLKNPEAADEVIARLLRNNPGNFRTHLIVAGYWRAYGKPDQSVGVVAKAVAAAQQFDPQERVELAVGRSVAEARRLAPDELDVILAAAELARARGRELSRTRKPKEGQQVLAEARQLLTRGVQLYPRSPRVYLALAALEADARRLPEAVAAVRQGLAPGAAPDSAELVLALLDYQVRAGDAAGASDTLGQLQAAGLPALLADYHKARVLTLKEAWPEAASVLERVRHELANDPALGRQVNALLGLCYAQLGENDRRLDAYTRALPDQTDPLWPTVMVGIAEAQAALGQADAAVLTYRKLADLAPAAWLQVARLEMIRALRSPPDQRDWKPAEAALAAAERAFKDIGDDLVPTDLFLVRADLLYYAQKKPVEARQELEALRGKRPKEAAVWIALAQQDLRDGNPKQAAATLAAAEAAAGDSPELRLARARLWVETKEPDLPARLAALAAPGDQFTPAQRNRLLRELAELATIAGAADLAGRFWEQLATANPHNLEVHLIRFDRALRADNEAAMMAVLADMEKVNGANAPSARLGKAVLLIWRAQKSKTSAGLNEALGLLDGLARERPGWSRVVLGQAVAHDLKGNADLALAKYKQAVELGETGVNALRRLTELLVAKGRFAEADEVYRKLPAAVASEPEMQRLAATVSLRIDPQRAAALAPNAVSANSTDPRDHLWLGQIYWAAGDRVRPEAPFRKAVELQPESPEGWFILIRYLLATDRRPEAEKTLEQAKDRVNKADRSLFLALAYAQTGPRDRATEAFRQARTERPDDVRVLRAEAEFLFRTNRLTEAREAFQRVNDLGTAPPEDKAFARRMLAICFAADRDLETSRKALEVLGLLDKNALPAGAVLTPDQRRERAVVLSLQKDRASRLEAIQLWEGLGDAQTPDDQFLLARAHLSVGNRAQARLVLANLLRRPEAAQSPTYVTFYAAWLIREGDLREAEPWVKQLEKLLPDALQTAEVVARWHAARKDPAAARKALFPRFEAPGAPVGVVARICEEVGLQPDAERLFQRFVAENKAAHPQTVLVLAGYYGRGGRTADALRVCEEARATVPAPAVGGVAVAALYAAPTPAPADMAKVAGWLDEAIARSKGEPRAGLLQLLASVRNLQGDYAASAALYRQAIDANPRDALAMNNLAFLLSARDGNHDEALRLLDAAKRIIGPHPDLLDTEAIVRLNRGDVAAARQLLEVVVAEVPSGVAYFHLALVELAGKRDLDARVAWKKAGELGLQLSDLHPLERKAYEGLVLKFGKPTG